MLCIYGNADHAFSGSLIHIDFTDLGLLTSEARIASHASGVLKELISQFVDLKSLLVNENQPFEDEGQEIMKASALRSICAIFEEDLNSCKGVPNEHLLDVISALFLKLGMYELVILMIIIRVNSCYFSFLVECYSEVLLSSWSIIQIHGKNTFNC